jgi:hypothetical protein
MTELTLHEPRTSPEAAAPWPSDATTPASLPIPRSRRAVLAGALAGLGATVASAIGHVAAVDAANGDVVHVGDQALTGTQTTIISSATESISVLWGNATSASGTGVGIRGDSASPFGSGVWGTSPGTGVKGTSDIGTGVRGTSNTGIGVRGTSGPGTGIVGIASVVGDSDTGTGVQGESNSGTAVRGLGFHGVGVYGYSSSEAGVFGNSSKGPGVLGEGESNHGVWGKTTNGSGAGVFGQTVSSDGSSAGVRGISFPLSGPTKGVIGESRSPDGIGVEGFAKATTGPAAGVLGLARTPIGFGASGLNLATSGDAVGVRGSTSSPTGRGVVGSATGGQGVRGEATSGVGLFGASSTGFALRTNGRVKADKVSGVATIGVGKRSVTVTPGVDITAGSFVLLTPRTDIGARRLWFSTDPTNNRFAIHISSARVRTTAVAWLLLG